MNMIMSMSKYERGMVESDLDSVLLIEIVM